MSLTFNIDAHGNGTLTCELLQSQNSNNVSNMRCDGILTLNNIKVNMSDIDKLQISGTSDDDCGKYTKDYKYSIGGDRSGNTCNFNQMKQVDCENSHGADCFKCANESELSTDDNGNKCLSEYIKYCKETETNVCID